MKLSFLLCTLVAYFCAAVVGNYSEVLELTPLPNGHLSTSFQFAIRSFEFPLDENMDSIISDFNIFPNSLINLISQTNTHDFNVRLTNGYWNSESWGTLPKNGSTSGGNGLEIWATIKADTEAEAFENWRFLVNSLSGFFCASLNFIDETITTEPTITFGDQQHNGDKKYLFRAALPREPVCTENLTPIVKLLPTKGRAGISSLLDGHKLFDSKWVSTFIGIKTVEDYDNNLKHFELDIDLNNVFHIPTSLDKIKRPLPKPIPGEELHCDYDKFYDLYHCFPSNDYSKGMEFDLDKIFGRKIKIDRKIGTSKVCVNIVEQNKPDWEVNCEFSSMDFSSGHFLFSGTNLDENGCYELVNEPEKKEDFDVKFHLKNSVNNIAVSSFPDIYVTRSLTGYELDKGGFRTVFKNPTNNTLKLVYFETFPWYFRIFLSSLKTTMNGETNTEIIKNITYKTAVDRKRPATLEWSIEVPANSLVTLTYQFDKSLLLYTEYPPDANHGFELEPAVVTLLNDVQEPYYYLRTSTLLVQLPTPDFSMPYNVIILTSTIMALVFGTVFNLLVKRVISEEDYEKLMSLTPRKNLKYFVAQFKDKIRAKLATLKTGKRGGRAAKAGKAD